MSFFSLRQTRRSRPARRLPSSFRPRLEALEDRCLLSAGALDPTFGSGAGYVTTSLRRRHSGPSEHPAGAVWPTGRGLFSHPGGGPGTIFADPSAPAPGKKLGRQT